VETLGLRFVNGRLAPISQSSDVSSSISPKSGFRSSIWRSSCAHSDRRSSGNLDGSLSSSSSLSRRLISNSLLAQPDDDAKPYGEKPSLGAIPVFPPGKRSFKLTDTLFIVCSRVLTPHCSRLPLSEAARTFSRTKSACGAANLGSAASAAIRAACFPGCLNLFPSSYVRLRQSDVLFCAGNLALMSLCESFVHTSHYTRTTVLIPKGLPLSLLNVAEGFEPDRERLGADFRARFVAWRWPEDATDVLPASILDVPLHPALQSRI
jgi:hypothetical protein